VVLRDDYRVGGREIWEFDADADAEAFAETLEALFV